MSGCFYRINLRGLYIFGFILAIFSVLDKELKTLIFKLSSQTPQPLEKILFGLTQEGKKIFKFILTSSSGIQVHVLTYGATIQKLLVPHKDGSVVDVVLGFENLVDYENDHPYFGAIIGRNANRLRDGKIYIDHKEIQLTQNEGKNQLHGGFVGFGKKIWDFEEHSGNLHLFYTSPHGEEGYPGNLKVEATFSWQGDTLVMGHHAVTDRATVVNLTRHEYFNLAQGGNILAHKLHIDADAYLPINTEELPTGEIASVKGTAMHLDGKRTIREHLKKINTGFNHNFLLNKRNTTAPAAVLLSPEGNLKMSLYCTHPGLQFFSADNLGDWSGKYGKIAPHNPALCLEPQHFPDTPAHAHFPSTVLSAQDVYKEEIAYRFEFI